MQDDHGLIIPRNPQQVPASQFRLSRNLKVRGDAIYIIFSGIVASVFLFFCLMDTSAVLAVATAWIPLVVSVWFYFRFVREKPRYYFEYFLNSLYGNTLRIDSHKKLLLKARKK